MAFFATDSCPRTDRRSVNPRLRVCWRFRDPASETICLFWQLSQSGFRFYSPTFARWFSRDPIGEEEGVNVTDYVGNEPVTRVDAFGLEWTVLRKGRSRACVQARASEDTIGTLARRVGLEAEQVVHWLKDDLGRGVRDRELCKWYTIPNIVILAIGDVPRFPSYPLLRAASAPMFAHLSRRGSSIQYFDWYSSSYTSADVRSKADNDLHGFVFMGHGTHYLNAQDMNGWFAIHRYGLPIIGDTDDVTPGMMEKPHKLGLVVVVVCYASETRWGSLGSSNAEIYVQPYRMTWPWRVPEILFNAVTTVWEAK